jgi:NAD(P)-dependent dehydrogenase (short-subunit alcohol dehydrogenase family)
MDQPRRSKQGKVALVTGARQGLGLAFARRLAAEGATVVAVDRAEAADLAAELKEAGAADAAFFQADISRETEVVQMAAGLIDRFGRCDIIVNNAGILHNTPLGSTSLADWRGIMAVNIDAMFLICRALVPGMAERNYGRVVNIASDMLGTIAAGFGAYFASKGAVIGFTRALANEFAQQGVVANCIAPGFTRTPRTEQEVGDGPMFEIITKLQAIKREAAPEDMVGAMSFLASDDAAFITGQTLIVDGGLLKTI